MKEVRLKVQRFLEPALKGQVIDDDENIFELGLVHSLFAMQIILFIEKEFNLELEPDEMKLEELSSIDSIVSMISRHLSVAK